MPQQSQGISPEALNGFLGLTDDEKIVALGSMSEGTKAQLLGALKGQSGGPPPDARTAQQVAADQIMNVGRGIPQAVLNIPSTAIGVGRAMLQSNPMERDRQLGEMAVNAFQPVTTSVKGALSGRAVALPGMTGPIQFPEFPEGNPDNPAWPQAAQGAGANLGGLALGAGAAKLTNAAKAALLKRAPEVYQTVLKPRIGGRTPTTIEAINKTGVSEAIPVSDAGLNRLDSLVNDLNASIEADIQSNPRAPISPTRTVNRVAADALKKAQTQVNPEADVKAVNSSLDEFLRNNPVTIAAEDAQALKKGTYQQIYGKHETELGTSSKNAQAQLARGLKEELETHFPEIKAANARESALFDLQPELQRAINRRGNQPMSVAKTLNILRNPAIISRVAIMMHKAGVAPAVVKARIAAFTAGLAANTEPQQ